MIRWKILFPIYNISFVFVEKKLLKFKPNIFLINIYKKVLRWEEFSTITPFNHYAVVYKTIHNYFKLNHMTN